jgi:pimeloyl-ACP methyl ester carboxylesterase
VGSGRRDTLVLLHGFLGGSGYWSPQRAAFGQRFLVVAPDLPGFSAAGDLEAPDSLRQFAHWVLRDLHARGIERFHLVGHSMGGMIAQEIAVAAPRRVRRLVLYGTACRGKVPGRFETIAQTRDRLRRLGVDSVRRTIAAKWFVDGERHPHFQTCTRAGAGVTERAALRALRALSRWDFRRSLGRIRSRCLVLCGDQDRSCNVSESLRIWKGVEGSRLCVVPGCSHNVHLERTELFNRIVMEFLVAQPG